jgi:hypothetical protein
MRAKVKVIARSASDPMALTKALSLGRDLGWLDLTESSLARSVSIGGLALSLVRSFALLLLTLVAISLFDQSLPR